jgi:hypothetical protein
MTLASAVTERGKGSSQRERLIMRTVRFPIAGLMVDVLIVALGLAALRNSSATWAGMTFLLTSAVLCLADDVTNLQAFSTGCGAPLRSR